MIETENYLNPDEENAFDKSFKRRGAITLFIQLVLLAYVFWYGAYFLMHVRI